MNTFNKSYRIYFSLIFLLFLLIPALPQSKDKAAKVVLDNFSSKTKSLPGARSDFTFIMTDLNDNSEYSINGTFMMKGEMYKVNMDETEIYYNGKTLWNHIVEAGEVNVLTPPEEPDPDSYFENPVRFFSIYEKDFFYKYIKEENIEEKDVHIIDLYPKDIKRSFTRIRLLIGKEDFELYSAKYFGKNKIHYTIKIINFTSQKIPDKAFSFDPAAHPDVDIIDLR